MFRQGSCTLKTEVFKVVKHNDNGSPVRRLRRKSSIVHSKNIADRRFWNKHAHLQKELGSFTKDIGKVEPDYIRSFQFEDKLIPSTWVVVRIDGCHFHSEMVSVLVSFFTSMYVMKWKDFFPQKELKYPPCFDGRAVCYPSYEILRDYLSWRQVDCHINNQYSTLVKSGKTKTEAQNALKGTPTGDREKLLRLFGIEYNELPVMFRRGSSAFWGTTRIDKNGECNGNSGKRVVVQHCNIIEPSFWDALPTILSG